MVISLHPHHHHVVDVAPEELLESCSGGHGAITRKTSTNEDKVGIFIHYKALTGSMVIKLLSILCKGLLSSGIDNKI